MREREGRGGKGEGKRGEGIVMREGATVSWRLALVGLSQQEGCRVFSAKQSLQSGVKEKGESSALGCL